MIGKLLCAVALASAALAQGVSIALPAAGTKVAAGSAMVVSLERPTPSTNFEDISIVIAASACLAGCFNNGLGYYLLYSGPFSPTSTDSTGKEHQNITVTAPNTFNGIMQLSVAHFYLEGLANAAVLEFTNTTVNLTGASG